MQDLLSLDPEPVANGESRESSLDLGVKTNPLDSLESSLQDLDIDFSGSGSQVITSSTSTTGGQHDRQISDASESNMIGGSDEGKNFFPLTYTDMKLL